MTEKADLRILRPQVKRDALTAAGGQLKNGKNEKHKNKLKNK